ncbi:hypothetical protein Asch03_03368 [Acinetobacter schindleri]
MHLIKKKIKEWLVDGSFYFLVCILGIVILAWFLKNWLQVGDEVIAGISAALITLLGVKLTNKNSQKTLDKQLAQQKETFEIQLKDQAEGFKEQIKHQNELLEKQLNHQSLENEKQRKQKIRYDQYIKLVKYMSELRSYFTSQAIISFDAELILKKLSILKEIIDISKTVSSNKILNQLDELYSKYHSFSIKFLRECDNLNSLQFQKEEKLNAMKFIQKINKLIAHNFFKNPNENNHDDIEIILKEKEKNESQIKELDRAIVEERKRILTFLKSDVDELKLVTSVMIIFINVELGYSEYKDHLE